jgi:hypothetical protein
MRCSIVKNSICRGKGGYPPGEEFGETLHERLSGSSAAEGEALELHPFARKAI